MQAVQYSKLGLTSKVIPANPNGEYPYEVLGFVLPHEALRREFDRGRKAFRNIDVSSEKWKIEALVEWLDDFFIPFLHVHHYVEDNIIFPFYFALGIVAPERQAEDHVSLIGRMNKLQSLARQLLHVTHNSKESAKMKTLEEKVRKEFLDLVSHCEDHFNEEEEYWPPILKKYGRENWTKVERMIFQYTTSFGDSNAGDAYRNTICSICFAMGIMIGKDSIATNPRKEVDSEGNEVLPWAGTAIQQHYIDTRPFFIRKVKMKAWNQRYLQFRQLICSIGQSECDEHGNVKTSSGWVSKKNKDGKYVDRYHKPFTPIILFVMITAMFCLAAIPFFAAVSNPLRNLKYLHIKVVNYDVGPVGHAFDHFLEAVESSSNKIPTFRYEKDTSIGFDTYRRRVLDGEAWALLSVNPGASSALAAAFANGCQNAGSYNPADAITFSWDEGRNNQVATPYIGGFTKGILGKFATKFAANYISSLSQTDISDCIANGQSQLLVSPITFTEDNMTPVSVSYVVSSAGITVGNILMAVFGAMFILNATYGATAALAEDYSPKGKVILRLFTMALVGFGVSIAYATVSKFSFSFFLLSKI
jgi:hemerythrin